MKIIQTQTHENEEDRARWQFWSPVWHHLLHHWYHHKAGCQRKLHSWLGRVRNVIEKGKGLLNNLYSSPPLLSYLATNRLFIETIIQIKFPFPKHNKKIPFSFVPANLQTPSGSRLIHYTMCSCLLLSLANKWWLIPVEVNKNQLKPYTQSLNLTYFPSSYLIYSNLHSNTRFGYKSELKGKCLTVVKHKYIGQLWKFEQFYRICNLTHYLPAIFIKKSNCHVCLEDKQQK